MVYAPAIVMQTNIVISIPFQEYGIFDALEKRYLRSFIFGIYLVILYASAHHASTDLVL